MPGRPSYVHLHIILSPPRLTNNSIFRPIFDPAEPQLRLFLASDLSKSMILEDLTLIAQPTNWILDAGTLRRSPCGFEPLPLPSPLKVVLKSFDRRAAHTVRRKLKLPAWNMRREAIYRSLSTREAEERLNNLTNDLATGSAGIEDRLGGRYEKYLKRNGHYGFLDRSAGEVDDDSLVADEELLVQLMCHRTCQAEARIYRILQQEQGRAIPFCFEEVLTPAIEGIHKPNSFLTKCPGLLLEAIRGLTVEESLIFLSRYPGLNVGPVVSQTLVSANILFSHKILLRDIRPRNIMLCTRSLEERRKDVEEYALIKYTMQRADVEQGGESIEGGDELPEFSGYPIRVMPQNGEESVPVILKSEINLETSYVVFIDFESCRVEADTSKLAETAYYILERLMPSFNQVKIPIPDDWEMMMRYIDNRYATYSKGLPAGHPVRRALDGMMAALCWQDISPMDSMETYSTCYNISLRGSIIINEEKEQDDQRYAGGWWTRENWWRQAVRRIAVELFGDDPDEAELRFKNFLGVASAVDSSQFAAGDSMGAPQDGQVINTGKNNPTGLSISIGNLPEYLPETRSGNTPSSPSKASEIPIGQLFTKSRDTWRLIEGPPPLRVPISNLVT